MEKRTEQTPEFDDLTLVEGIIAIGAVALTMWGMKKISDFHRKLRDMPPEDVDTWAKRGFTKSA